MAGENTNSGDLALRTLLLQALIDDPQLQTRLSDLGISSERVDAAIVSETPEYVQSARDAFEAAGITVDGASVEDLRAAAAANPELHPQLNVIATEAITAVSSELLNQGDTSPAVVTTDATATTTEAEIAAANGSDVQPTTGETVAESTIPAEGFTTAQQQITAMQEVLMRPEVVAVTGIDGHTIGNSETGLPDGIRGDGTNSAFQALAQAAGGRPDMANYLLELGVPEEDVTKFSMAHASYVGAGNESPIVLAENPQAVADIQTALRTNDELIGLTANGIDVNTGSSTARHQSDNDLGPLTARAIQGTVALAVTAQAPDGTTVTHELTEENIGHVQAYLTEQGVEGADAIAANLRRIADDPALSAQYAQAVVPDSIEYAELSVPGSETEEAVEVAEADVPLKAFGGEGEEYESFADGMDAAVEEELAATDEETVEAVPVSLGPDFGIQTNGGLATATLTVPQFEAMRDGTNYESVGSEEIRILGTAALELEGLPAYQERARLYEEQSAAIEAMQSGEVTEAAIAQFEEANRLDRELTEELRSHEFEIDYTYTTGRNGGEVTHTATFEGTMADFEEEFGTGGLLNINQRGEASLRPQIEAAYAELEADPAVVERRAEIDTMRTEAEGMERAHADAFQERRERIAELDGQLADTELTIVIPDDIDQGMAEAMITDAGGTYTPAPVEETTPAVPEVMAGEPEATAAEGTEMAEDTTAVPPAGELQALNTRGTPGLGSSGFA